MLHREPRRQSSHRADFDANDARSGRVDAINPQSLREIGQDPLPILALANGPEAKEALMEETAATRDLGIFGSPTFAVGRELFWGDDRLEDAISWYQHGGLQSSC